MKAAPCLICGEMYTLNTALYATAMHDCETGDWLVMPRHVADAINAMTDADVAELAGIDIAEARALMARAIRQPGSGRRPGQP